MQVVKRTLPLAIAFLLVTLSTQQTLAQCGCNFVIAAATWKFDGAALGVKPGDKICFANGVRKNLEIHNVIGTPDKPVTITNMCDGKMTVQGSTTSVTPFAIDVYASSFIHFTGSGNPSEEFGIEIIGTHMGLEMRGLTTDYEVDHIYIHDITSVAFTGHTDPTCDPKTWYGNFIMRNAHYHHNRVVNSGDEGFYVGNSHYTSGVTKTCNGAPLKIFEHEVIGVNIHDNVVLNPGRDGIQVGSTTSGCNIYDNLVENWATKAIYAHKSGIQINQGTVANIYRNKLLKGTGFGIFISGSGGTRVVNNIVTDALEGGIFANDFAPFYPGSSFVFLNNTFINIRDYGIYMQSTGTVNNLCMNNIIVAPFPAQPTFAYIKLSNTSPANWTDKNNIKAADIATLKFENASANNFKLLTGSPAIDAGADLTASGVTSDFEQNARPVNAKFDIGAYEFQTSAPKANAGPDQTLVLPTNTTILNGTGTGSAGTITYLWTKKSGGAATLANETTPSLTLTGLVEGVYVFQLQVSDANGIGLDDVTVTVLPVGTNLPPTVNAGTDQAITLPANTANFTAIGTDADGSIASYAWTQVSGPSTATLANQNTNTLAASALVAGSYDFQVTVTDDMGATGSDVVRIVVNAAAANVAPKVNTGTDKTINLPTNSIVLTATATDSDGTIASLLWEKKSGPTATLANTNTLSLTASALLQGSYIFRLTATDDKGATGFDEVKVTVATGNQNPTANAGTDKVLTLPTNTINITGTGTDPDGSITTYLWNKVSGGAATITNAGQATVTLSGLVAGVYVMGFTVTDNSGATAYDEIKITVNAAGNQTPTANAGVDKTITLPTNSLTLNGSGTDPDGTIAAYLWTKKSGPAAILTNAATKDLGLTNLVAGPYVFTLRVTDNSGAFDDDDVTVTVLPATINQSPVANAGGNKYLTLPTNTVSLLGAGSDPDGTIALYAWTKDQGPAAIMTNANTATLNLSNLVEGEYLFNLTVTDNKGATASDFATVIVSSGNFPPLVEAGPNQTIILPTDATTVPATVSDPDGTISVYAWTQVSGPAATIAGANTATLALSNLLQGTYVFSLTATDDDGDFASDNVTISVLPNSTNQVPVVTAGSDQGIFLPTNSVVLNGNATDADGTITTYLWTQTSGPVATLINAGNASLTVTGLVQGTYVFRLTATDNSGTSAFDEAKVTVNAATQNQPPLVNAGPNQIILLPTNLTNLSGSAVDNDGSITSYVWTKISGPTATLQNTTTPTLNVTNLLEGTYVFRLTVKDNGGATVFAEARVIVFPAAVNQTPIADAGTNQTIVLPTNSTSLVGAGSDPDGTVTTYAWTKLSGPASSSIVTPANKITSLTNLVLGTYVFRLTVTDNSGSTGSDDVTIIVNDGSANAPPIANAGGNQTLTLPTNATNLFGSGSDSNGSIASYLWTKISGGAATLTNPASPTLTVTNLQAGTYQFRLRVTDNGGLTNDDVATILVNSAASNQPPIANAGTDKVLILPVNSATIVGSGTDQDGSITSYLWEKKVGGAATLGVTTTTSLQLNGLQEGLYVFRLTVTDNAGFTDFDEMNVRILPANTNIPPTVQAGSDTTIFLPNSSVLLTPTVGDADGTVDVFFWSKISGPAATIVDPNVQDVQIDNLVQGVYIFQLSAIDNQNTSSSDQIKVTVIPGGINQAPVVDATANRTIALPTNAVSITGTASDLDGTIASVLWVKLSGGAVSIAGETTLNLDLTNLVVGTYEFELQATDNSGATSTDRITIIVNPVPPNQPPLVSAGESISIILPANEATFLGTAVDSDGTVASYLWTKQSGPNATLQNATTTDLTASNLVAGFYVFRLSATDNSGNVGFDEVILVVSEEPSTDPNQPPVVYAGPDTTFVAPVSSTITIFGEAVDLDGGVISEYVWTQTSGEPLEFSASTSFLTFENVPVGVYEFTLTASDADGNSASDKMILTVIDKESDITNFIPKYFSPNNDGFNDKWTFKNTEVVKDCNLSVYTREGKLVYEALSYDNSWDGSFNGRKLSDGDYYYVIKFNGNILVAGGVRIIQ